MCTSRYFVHSVLVRGYHTLLLFTLDYTRRVLYCPWADYPASHRLHTNLVATATHPLTDDSAMSDHDKLSLTENSLRTCVYNEGLNAAQWEEIGAHLGLPTSALKEIEYIYPRSPTMCLLEVVSRWIKSNSAASREEFLQALK